VLVDSALQRLQCLALLLLGFFVVFPPRLRERDDRA
jgi:hypothetical protein